MKKKEDWIELVKAVCLLAGGWIGYENSPDPDIVEKHNKTMQSTAVALKRKAQILLKDEYGTL